jgi:protein phosphatase
MLIVEFGAVLALIVVAWVILRSRRTISLTPSAAPPESKPALGAMVFSDALGTEIVSLEQSDDDDDETSNSQSSMVAVAYEEEAEVPEVTAASARILVAAQGESDRGNVRKRNEDSMLLLPERSLYAIADGMGGHAGGDVASAVAIDTIRDAFERQALEGDLECDKPLPAPAREVACAIQRANQAVRACARADRSLSGMGTTVLVARFAPKEQRLYVAHVGDSRCYQLRGGELRRLTRDHTLGMLGQRGRQSDRLFQALGVTAKVFIDVVVEKPRPGDRYLLCTDGLSKMATDDQIRDILLLEPDIDSAAATLIALAKDLGGRDNITIILIEVAAGARDRAAPLPNADSVHESSSGIHYGRSSSLDCESKEDGFCTISDS